jgi:RNA polymerase sigma-70 factor, ECF subfamily
LAIARDDLHRAMEVLSTLPSKEQVAFCMYYLDGKEQEEIGQFLGHSKGYICKLIQRAVETLEKAGWEVSR